MEPIHSMPGLGRRGLLKGAAAGVVCASTGLRPARAQSALGETYVCPPCGCDADGREFAGPGTCPACGMSLQPQDPPFEPEELVPGATLFYTSGGMGHEDAHIGVHTFLPRSYTRNSPILLILPGDGRNGADYRDAWIGTAEDSGVLVAALSYPEEFYDFAAYQMGGVIRNIRVRNLPVGPDGDMPSIIRLRDEDISFDLNPKPETWLFNDFDRIFRLVASMAGSERTSYDLFGHSAGGQILHRAVLFSPNLRADRIVAANAGQYTQPEPGLPLLIGMKDTGMTEASLRESFGRELILLLGEKDNGPDAGGTLLRTPQLDRYGVYRLERGRRFFAAATERSRAIRSEFNWSLITVPDVGHDFRAMSRAAARRLYG